MKKDDEEILKEIQKSTGMAVKAIGMISEKICDDIMRYELSKEKRKFSELYHKAEERLLQEKANGYHGSAVEDMLLKGSINMNTILNCSSSKLAELMIQGSNRGMTGMWKAMNHYDGATQASLEIATEFMDLEEKCIAQLKRYL